MKGLIPNPETKVVPHGTCPNCGKRVMSYIASGLNSYHRGLGQILDYRYNWEKCRSCGWLFKEISWQAYETCKAVVDNWEHGDLAKAARMCQTVVDTRLFGENQ